ncbi:hypothetical protein Sango_3114900 [Sesamum angolense]|uniref:C2 domain-containing protein n=1 Tax=Sesamum angolense TaxID=2727404 RepID=A0AAE1T7V8_9LAMI|nr:hypothetical protein Sango_3114900 [Sesamum angolense]
MDPDQGDYSSSLSCELRIIKAKNIDHIMKSSSSSAGVVLFVRCYLSAGNNTRVVRLETHETGIPSKSDGDHSMITWNSTFSLDCSGAQESINRLTQGSAVVFELRPRSSFPPLIGRIQGSKLIGRGEVPWKNVVESADMEIEQWVVMILAGREYDEDVVKQLPAVQIAINIQECGKRKEVSEGRWGVHNEECGSCVDYEFFAIGAALEAL